MKLRFCPTCGKQTSNRYTFLKQRLQAVIICPKDRFAYVCTNCHQEFVLSVWQKLLTFLIMAFGSIMIFLRIKFGEWNPSVVALIAFLPLEYLAALLPQVLLPWKVKKSQEPSSKRKERLTFFAIDAVAFLIGALCRVAVNA